MQTRWWHLLALVVFLNLFILVSSQSAQSAHAQATGTTDHISVASDPIRVSAALQSAPVMFIENVGQFTEGARFQVYSGNGSIYLADDAIWFTILERPKTNVSKPEFPLISDGFNNPEPTEPRKGVNLKLSFVGANSHPILEPFDRLDTHVSYFIGNDESKWRADVPVWGGVRYENLYPGIDLEITSEHGRMVQRVVSRPGANLKKVRLMVEGADQIALDGGRLRLSSAVGEYTMPLLQVDGTTKPNLLRPTVKDNQVSLPFTETTISHQPSAISNSSDLLYATFLGGSEQECLWRCSIAVDSSGAIYVASYTYSANFPTTPGAFDTTCGTDGNCNGWTDAFVAKLNPAGNGQSDLAYATFLGGSEDDCVFSCDMTIDVSGAAYVTGSTDSLDFPSTPGAFDTICGSSGVFCDDIFVAKLSATGSLLVYATFLGGDTWREDSTAIAVDGGGAVYVTGYTNSPDFPTTPGAFDTTCGNDGTCNAWRDAFVVKLNLNSMGASDLAYATFLGESENDESNGIAVDGGGTVYVTGLTDSSTFPTTSGAFDTTFSGFEDAFVVKLNPAGNGPSDLIYATFLGDSSSDEGEDIAVGDSGAVYVTGYTYSSAFPTTPNAFDRTYNGNGDPFVVKMNLSGMGSSDLAYSTFLGGSGWDGGFGVDVDGSGSACVTGPTVSPDFPTTPNAFDRTCGTDGNCNFVLGYGRQADAFVAKLTMNSSSLTYSTFLGGGLIDVGEGIAVDESGVAYITGWTWSHDFPTTVGALDTSQNGSYSDAFVVKLGMGGKHSTTTTLTSTPNPSEVGENVTFTATVTSSGGTPTGAVTFKEGATTLGTETLDGSGGATFATSTLAAGSRSITAEYGGDSNFSGSTSSPLIQRVARIVEDKDPSVQYDNWRGVSDSNASGGTYRVSNKKNDKVTFKFKGKSIKWVSLKGPDQGKAQVFIDGVDKGTFDLYSPNVQYQFAKTFRRLTNAKHTIVIQVPGTKNDSATDTNVVVDAFVVGKMRTQDDSTALVYNKWKGEKNEEASGGSYRASGKAGAVAQFTFIGTSVDWITAKGPSYAKAKVLIDGVDKGDVDLYAVTQQWKVAISFTGLSDGQHTIEIKPLGTKNNKSKGTTVIVDAFRGPFTAIGP